MTLDIVTKGIPYLHMAIVAVMFLSGVPRIFSYTALISAGLLAFTLPSKTFILERSIAAFCASFSDKNSYPPTINLSLPFPSSAAILSSVRCYEYVNTSSLKSLVAPCHRLWSVVKIFAALISGINTKSPVSPFRRIWKHDLDIFPISIHSQIHNVIVAFLLDISGISYTDHS